MNALPTTGELFATNQVSPETERYYKYQLRSFENWVWLCNSSIRAWRELQTLRRAAAVDDVATHKVLQVYDEDNSS
ncbi:MAG: hypothetical protein MK000_08805 [Anaerolineales bacterium]|nr:hypothetical protein [Anaerolineales bacterium]